MRCIGQPISWLALERYALGEGDPKLRATIREHLEQCPTCHDCFVAIENDSRRMPPLRAPAPRPRIAAQLRWVLATAATAGALLLVWSLWPERKMTGIKGGRPTLELIREHDGEILRADAFAAGDRFKVLLTCSSGLSYADVAVIQGQEVSYPLPARRVHCGNRVHLPGAFALEGDAARICVVLSKKRAPPRGSVPAEAPCVEINPADAPPLAQ